MTKNKYYILLIFVFLILITACSKENQNTETNQNSSEPTEQKEQSDSEEMVSNDDNSKESINKENSSEKVIENIPAIPTDIAGFASQSPGMFASKSIWDNEEKVKEELKKLKPMSENPTEQEYKKYLSYMYWLVAEDFPTPKDVVKKWEFASFGNPNLPDARFHFKENYNIEIILDSSGSMAANVNGNTRMELAKEAINNFLKNIPEKANVSLRVYGHKGSSSEGDKKMSCEAIEQVYGFAPYNKKKFQQALNEFSPKGWTPIAAALKQSQYELKQFDAKSNTNLIYLVSDGIGTCGGDPVKVAESLSKSTAKPIINIIGYQADAEAQEQLQKMAEVSNGIYTTVNDQKELEEEFNRAEEVLESWKDWKEDAIDDLDAIGVDNNFDILGITNEWHFTSLSIGNNLSRVISVAEEAGIITSDQESKLDSMEDEVVDKINILKDEIEKNLESISVENIEKMKKSINEKYNKQTQN